MAKQTKKKDDEDESKRELRVPCPPWWLEKVNALIATRKIAKRDLAKVIGFSEFQVGRTLNGERPLLGVILGIAKHLRIPSPIFFAETEEDLPPLERAVPTENDSAETIIRKNAIRFREEAGYDQTNAASVAALDLSQLRAYEDGKEVLPPSMLATLAKLYGREPGHFYDVHPPAADPTKLPRVRVFVHPSVAAEDRARVLELAQLIDDKYRNDQRAMTDHVLKVRKQRG